MNYLYGVLCYPKRRKEAETMASFVKLRLSELVVNSRGHLVCLEDEGQSRRIYGDPGEEFCFNMLTEVEGLGICFGFSPRFVDARLGW